MNVKKELFKLQDKKYKDFIANLTPTINPDNIIGVKNPKVRKLAIDFFKQGDYQKFLNKLPHKYFEENNLHSFLIEQIKDYDECIKQLEKFFPYINSWATCDSLKPKVLEKHKKELIIKIRKWIKSKDLYTVRYAILCLMRYYLKDDYNPTYLKLVKDVKSKDYYINMMRAWFFATALVYQRNDTLNLLKSKSLDPWTHNKTISKAIESFRISNKDKKYLRTFKV